MSHLHFMEKSHRLLILVFCRGVITLFQGKRNGIVLTLIGDFREGFKLQVQQLDLGGEFFASGFVIARDLQLGFRHCGFALEGGEVFAGFGIKFQFSFPERVGSVVEIRDPVLLDQDGEFLAVVLDEVRLRDEFVIQCHESCVGS